MSYNTWRCRVARGLIGDSVAYRAHRKAQRHTCRHWAKLSIVRDIRAHRSALKTQEYTNVLGGRGALEPQGAQVFLEAEGHTRRQSGALETQEHTGHTLRHQCALEHLGHIGVQL